jgi:hypothetical protein
LIPRARSAQMPRRGLADMLSLATALMDEAAKAGVPLVFLPTIARRMDEVIAQGHAHDDWTVLGADALGVWSRKEG